MKILTPNQLFRNNTAQALKEIHGALLKVEPPLVAEGAKFSAFWVRAIVGCALIILVASSTQAHAYTDQEAIRTIVGEASNQGEIGMIAVGEVIRARGSLKGIYGFKAPHVDKEPAWVWKMARKAWLASKTTNYTKGARYFENIQAFGCPSWAKNCVVTFRHKDHVFMKEASNV